MSLRYCFEKSKILRTLSKSRKNDLAVIDNAFSGEAQAMYFSNARRFLSSTTSAIIINGNQDLRELSVIGITGKKSWH